MQICLVLKEVHVTPGLLLCIMHMCLLATARAAKLAAAFEVNVEIDPAFIGVKFDPAYKPGLFQSQSHSEQLFLIERHVAHLLYHNAPEFLGDEPRFLLS